MNDDLFEHAFNIINKNCNIIIKNKNEIIYINL